MSNGNEEIYAVEGMTCDHCEQSVREEVEGLDGVESATADRATGRLTVRGVGIDDAAILAAVQAAGYSIAVAGAAPPRSDDDLHISG